MTASDNKRLALHAFHEFAKGNVDVLRTVLHEDFVEHSPGNPSGRDAFIEFITQAPVAGAQLDLRRVVADDTYVVMHYLMSTPRGDHAPHRTTHPAVRPGRRAGAPQMDATRRHP
ncbi:nuclear transport factor 2 family protein [Kribbella sp. NPDC050124]|uniref:nuclear transport factor 2 family protein n=1 Tax=Kribbella sp. NPDC050124 TaxID=3364114 RepID=UPI00379F03D7